MLHKLIKDADGKVYCNAEIVMNIFINIPNVKEAFKEVNGKLVEFEAISGDGEINFDVMDSIIKEAERKYQLPLGDLVELAIELDKETKRSTPFYMFKLLFCYKEIK